MFALAGQVTGFIVKDIFWSVLYFPIWWYTRGLLRILNLIKREIFGVARMLHIPTLFKYLLKPMYGYTDIISRIISFYVRIVQFIVLLAFTLVVVAGLLVLLAVWMLAPVITLYGLGYHLGWIPLNLYQPLAWNAGLQI